jgi:hypothetical protein
MHRTRFARFISFAIYLAISAALSFCLSLAFQENPQQNLCRNSELCMIYLALIPIMIYNAQVAFTALPRHR